MDSPCTGAQLIGRFPLVERHWGTANKKDAERQSFLHPSDTYQLIH